jgi:Zn-dependent peptidase ImmA (M78 family)
MKVRSALWAFILLFGLYRIVPIHYVDKGLESYVSDFEQLDKIYCPGGELPNQLVIKFGDLSKENWLGVCKISPVRSEVIFDKDYWTNADEDDKISLVFHELSHCILDLDHVDDPNNYMYPSYTRMNRDVVIAQTIKNIKETCK